ncbi:hypothetical protein ACFB49_18190 [Sphingomonas sp. DBB INV C78]|uniref:hypothetical protein n=1 Tax=Sphingomonas sp. DBB INV C78 TaxID=3349434 RepID=UPI0036D23E60
MYRFVDQPVTRLSNGARFTLWAMRAWVYALGQGRCPPGALTPAFARMGVLAALPDFHMAMALLNRDALEKLALAPLQCATIAEHEAVLLELWAEGAGGDEGRVCATLELLIADEIVVPVATAMMACAPKLTALDRVPVDMNHPQGGASS